MKYLKICDLNVSVSSRTVLKNINIEAEKGDVIVILGPNGAGKSTLLNAIMGHPEYEINKGKVFFDQVDITKLDTLARAKKKMFLSFQNPIEIEGISMINFLRQSYNQINNTDIGILNFDKILTEKMVELEMESYFKSRDLNLGFSGGEKKKSEILQLLLLEPDLVLLDEIDSGVDVDAIKTIGKILKKFQKDKNATFIIVTHNTFILDYLVPSKVIILKDGEIKKEGSNELVDEIKKFGF